MSNDIFNKELFAKALKKAAKNKNMTQDKLIIALKKLSQKEISAVYNVVDLLIENKK